MSLKTGVFLASNCIGSFAEKVTPPCRRENQWQRVLYAGANGRHCSIYKSKEMYLANSFYKTLLYSSKGIPNGTCYMANTHAIKNIAEATSILPLVISFNPNNLSVAIDYFLEKLSKRLKLSDQIKNNIRAAANLI